MPRYDLIYQTLAERAVSEAALDIRALVDRAAVVGMSAESVQEALLDDLENGGPIFGKFLRHLTGAAEQTVASAMDQGQRGGEIEASRSLRRLLRISTTEGSLLTQALDDADPEALADAEDALGPVIEYMWVAELVNTCYRCLPLHGQMRTLEEWNARGLDPAIMHEGWTRPCKCKRIPQEPGRERDSRAEQIAPLKRDKVVSATGLKGSKKTRRAITQQDMEKAIAARDAALESLEGRRTLRILGQAGK